MASVGSVTWVAVVDGLGHGPKAEESARAALDVFSTLSDEALGVRELFPLLHDALRGTRGAALTVLRCDASGVDLAAVGNVAVRGLSGLAVPLLPAGGVVGGRHRPPKVTRLVNQPGQEMLIFTDGISRRAPVDQLSHLSPQELCAQLIAAHSHGHDDATVLHLKFA